MKRLLLLACICSCLLLSCDNRARVMGNIRDCFPPGATNIAVTSSKYWYTFDLNSKHYCAFIDIGPYANNVEILPVEE